MTHTIETGNGTLKVCIIGFETVGKMLMARVRCQFGETRLRYPEELTPITGA